MSQRRYSRPEPGYSTHARNGHLAKAHLRPVPSVEDRDSGLESSESEGNQVSPQPPQVASGAEG